MERNQINPILQRYIDGQYSKSDMEYVLAAMARGEFTEQDLQGAIDNNRSETDIDILLVESIAANVEQQLFSKIKPKRFRFMRLLPYAAALMTALGIGLYFYYNQSPVSHQSDSSLVQQIPAGSNKATLILENGKTIDLEVTQKGLVMEDGRANYTDGTTVSTSDEIQQAKLVTPRAGQYQLTLGDGTKVYLNAASSLTYPTKFLGSTREITLTGEAYFEVKKDSKPFIVHTKDQTVEVLGTHFNINAYDNEPVVRTTLVEGSVAVKTDAGSSKILRPNQQSVQRSEKIIISDVDAGEYTAWTKGEIVLTNAELPAITRQLERWYDVEFDPVPKSLITKSVFGVLDRNLPLQDILNSLEKNYQVNFKTQGRRITIEEQ